MPARVILRDYQQRAVDQCLRSNTLLKIPMGGGKTIIALSTAFEMPPATWLILCPNALTTQWRSEIAKVSALNYRVWTMDDFYTTNGKRWQWVDRPNNNIHNFLIIPYSMIWREKAEWPINHLRPTNLICDESQNLKNYGTKRKPIRVTRWVVDNCDRFDRRLLLTGTVAKEPGHLWPQYRILGDNAVGGMNHYQFELAFSVFKEIPLSGRKKIKKFIGLRDEERLRNLLGPWTCNVSEEEVYAELPALTHVNVRVEPSSAQIKLYKQVRAQLEHLYDTYPSLVVEQAMHVVQKLHKVSSGVLREGPLAPNPKLYTAIDLIREDNCPWIVWATYRADVDYLVEQLAAAFQDRPVAKLYGGMSDDQRQSAIEQYNQGGILVANPSVGGVGLNLQAGNRMIYFSHPWSWFVRKQSMHRQHRTGQDKPTFIYDLVCLPIDQRIIDGYERGEEFEKSIIGPDQL